MKPMRKDAVDKIEEQWRCEREELNCAATRVVGRIMRIAQHLEREVECAFSHHNLMTCNFDVLTALRRSGKPYQLKPTELYCSLMLTSGAITNRLDKLEKDGLIVRKPNPEDRRGILVTLTQKGLELVDKVIVEHLDNEERLLAALTNEEREQLTGLLRKLLVSLEASPEMNKFKR